MASLLLGIASSGNASFTEATLPRQMIVDGRWLMWELGGEQDLGATGRSILGGGQA